MEGESDNRTQSQKDRIYQSWGPRFTYLLVGAIYVNKEYQTIRYKWEEHDFSFRHGEFKVFLRYPRDA